MLLQEHSSCLCRSENGKSFCLAELWPALIVRIHWDFTINAVHAFQNTNSLRSKRFLASSSRKLQGREQKTKEWRGRGRGMKETLARKPHDFEKLRSPTNAASDWCGAGSVDYLALETSIKLGMLCLRASQILLHLIWGRRLQMLWTDVYLNRVCAKVYKIKVFKVWLEIEQWTLGKAIGKANLLGMTACGSDWKKWTVCWR